MLIADDLRGKGDDLRAAVDDGALVLAVCGGYQLLGHRYRGHTGEEMRGISPGRPRDGRRRPADDRQRRAALRARSRACREALVGFENHAGRTTLGPGAGAARHASFAADGNNGEDGGEGVLTGRVIGTYVHGPLLPKNPWLADWLIRTGLDVDELEPLDDALELRGARSRRPALATRRLHHHRRSRLHHPRRSRPLRRLSRRAASA